MWTEVGKKPEIYLSMTWNIFKKSSSKCETHFPAPKVAINVVLLAQMMIYFAFNSQECLEMKSERASTLTSISSRLFFSIFLPVQHTKKK